MKKETDNSIKGALLQEHAPTLKQTINQIYKKIVFLSRVNPKIKIRSHLLSIKKNSPCLMNRRIVQTFNKCNALIRNLSTFLYYITTRATIIFSVHFFKLLTRALVGFRTNRDTGIT